MRLFNSIGDAILGKMAPKAEAAAQCVPENWYEYKCYPDGKFRRTCYLNLSCVKTCSRWKLVGYC